MARRLTKAQLELGLERMKRKHADLSGGESMSYDERRKKFVLAVDGNVLTLDKQTDWTGLISYLKSAGTCDPAGLILNMFYMWKDQDHKQAREIYWSDEFEAQVKSLVDGVSR